MRTCLRVCVWMPVPPCAQSENSALLDVTSKQYFCQNVALLRLNAAWDCARSLNMRPLWLALSGKAMEVRCWLTCLRGGGWGWGGWRAWGIAVALVG